jgi:hypothetical protein
MYKNILLINSYDLIQKYMDISTLSNMFNKIFRDNEIIIIQNHYWVFLNDWKEDKIMIKQWKSIYNKILENKETKIISYNELYDILKK